MRFEWDAEKSARNYRDRGFDFGAAVQIFSGFTLERADARRDYGEVRVIAIGLVARVALTLVYTDRRDRDGTIVRRIISARRSNRYERKRYKEAQSSEK
ncbi:MAG: BrnT family toxin [Gemmatimonadaceae bacterium]